MACSKLCCTSLAEFQEKAEKIKNKVASAMVYPMIVLVMALGILSFLLVFIVPKFEAIFHDMLGDKPLPTITLFVIGVSNFVKGHLVVMIGIVVVILAAYRYVARTERGKSTIDRMNCDCHCSVICCAKARSHGLPEPLAHW